MGDDGQAVLDCNGSRLGVAGTRGFGGGFPGRCATAFGEAQVKSFVSYSEELAQGLRETLTAVAADFKIALAHYAPVKDALVGKPIEIYPLLGSYLLAEAADDAAADLAVHGHAHAGTEKGATSGGVRVRNVAMPVLGRAYAIYCLGNDPVC